ncbi:GNAT family N-acetyltransferase [Thalassotalea sp. PLHSN55]|uniref:GNAT family N-acetyltransferase n=1 Tax=Thalassotalea sp. PLHSN55 TaxID=3435888 RepID=UPI003F874686
MKAFYLKLSDHLFNQIGINRFTAHPQSELVGAIFFSKITLANQKSAFILSPVAVATNHQKQGIAQQLIRFGIEQLTQDGVEILFTYGDPNYYNKVGFEPIDESIIKAPQPLSFPHGWLAQSLNHEPIAKINEPAKCVSALDDPKYW